MLYLLYFLFIVGHVSGTVQAIFSVELQTVAKVGLEFGHQSLLPVGDRLQPAEEEAQDLWFLVEFQTADEIAVFKQPVDPVQCIPDLSKGVDASGHGQAEELHG